MKRIQRFVCAVFVFLCIWGMTTGASAAVKNGDGIQITLTTDQKEYHENEQVRMTLTVKNTGDEVITEVQMLNQIPEKMVLAKGAQMEKTVPAVYPGETAELTTAFTLAPASKLPVTGDDSRMLLWIMAAALSLSVWAAIRQRRVKQFTAGMLCFVMVFGTVSPWTDVPAASAQGEVRVEIAETIALIGQEAQVCASVRSNEPGDPGVISFAYPDPDHVAHDEENGIYYLDNQILITTEANVPRSEVEKLIAPYAGRIVGWIQLTGDYQVEFPRAMSKAELQQIVQRIGADSSVQLVDLHELRLVGEDKVYDEEWLDSQWEENNGLGAKSDWTEEWTKSQPMGNWHMMMVDAPDAWKYADQMRTVNVGVYDSVFSEDHEDLKDVFIEVWNNDSEYAETEHHGTHVSGIIAAEHGNGKGILGASPNSRLYAYSWNGDVTDDTVKEAGFVFQSRMELKYAMAKMVTSGCRVLNFSTGLKGSLTAKERDSKRDGAIMDVFLDKLHEARIDYLIVQSAGNAGENANLNGFFVRCENKEEQIIVVGNVSFGWNEISQESNKPTDCVLNGKSNYGTRVDVAAPGTLIWSCIFDDYRFNSGTSMSAPLVSGIAAMCYGVNPKLTGAQVKDIIVRTAQSSGISARCSLDGNDYFVVNAARAVELAKQTKGNHRQPKDLGAVMGHVKRENWGDYKALDGVSATLHSVNSNGVWGSIRGETSSDEYGNYEIICDEGTYGLKLEKNKYIPLKIWNTHLAAGEVTYMKDVVLLKENNRKGIIEGVIRDAVTNEPIEGVSIVLAEDWENTDVYGGEIDRVYTDDQGKYRFEVDEGYYTALLYKPGYANGYINVYSENLGQIDDQDGVMTPSLRTGEYRAVLTWGETPEDLDSHIWGPLSGGGRYHVYFPEMEAEDRGEIVAMLDRDDVDSYGPETVTLSADRRGTYRYSVHDFTNYESVNSTALSESQAKVELYRGEKRIKVFYVPINKPGTIWNVFEIEDGQVRTINTMDYCTNPDEAGSGISAFALRRGAAPASRWAGKDKALLKKKMSNAITE